MSLYAIAVFLHIVGALGLFAALGLEWATLFNLRRATTPGQAREWARLFAALRRVGGPAAGTLLVTGIYMSLARWGQQPWIALGMAGLILIAVLGATLTGRRAAAIGRALASETTSVSADLERRLRDPVLLASAWVRTALALGIVFIMSVKPGGPGALTALGVALVLGLAAGSTAWGRAGQRRELGTAPTR
jgi:hypothetical protein